MTLPLPDKNGPMTGEQALAAVEQERLDVLAEGMTSEMAETTPAYVLASEYRKLRNSSGLEWVAGRQREACATYIEAIANNHPSMAHVYRHIAINVREACELVTNAEKRDSVRFVEQFSTPSHARDSEVIDAFLSKAKSFSAPSTTPQNSDEMQRLIATAAHHLRTWVSIHERGTFDTRPYGNTMDVAVRLEALAVRLASAPSATQHLDSRRLDWLDQHCAFVADEQYKIGPFQIGELRQMADAGLAADWANERISRSDGTAKGGA